MKKSFLVFSRQRFCLIILFTFLFTGIAFSQDSPNIVRVKFKTSLSPTLKAFEKSKSQKSLQGYVKTGIGNFDKVCAAHQVVTMKRVFRPAGKFEARHEKYGLDLWFELEISKNSNSNIKQTIADLRKTEGVETAEGLYSKKIYGNDDPIPVPVPSFVPNDPSFSAQWHYNNTGQTGGMIGADIRLTDAWNVEKGENNVTVAVIDGGIDIFHEDLNAAIWNNYTELNGIAGVDDDGNGYIDDIHGYGFGDNTGNFYPANHGTHVAGTIGAVSNNGIGVSGVAGGSGSGDGVRLMSCATFGSYGTGGFDDAFVYAADMGAVIAQNSWGYTNPGVYEQSVLDAIDYFIDNAGIDINGNQFGPMAGGIVIFAAGNANTDDHWYPGYYESVLSVASLNHNNIKAWYSNFGSWVDVSAPGGETNAVEQQGVLSTLPGNTYGYYQGTSMACPHVSGVAALIVSEMGGPGLTPQAVWSRLTSRNDDVDSYNPSYAGRLGSGRVNAFNALIPSDSIPPSPVNDLSAAGLSATSVKLTWTATGGSGTEGKAASYDIRYARFLINESNFDSATHCTNPPKPKFSGEVEQYETTGLHPLTSYYFAIKVMDVDGYQSGISNILQVQTLASPKMVITPDSFSVNLLSGEIRAENLTIDNTEGGSDLIYSIKVQNHNKDISVNFEKATQNISNKNENKSTANAPEFVKKVSVGVNGDSKILLLEQGVSYYYYDQALENLGMSRTLVNDFSIFLYELTGGTKWDLVIVNTYGSSLETRILDSLQSFVKNGGSLIFAAWDVEYYNTHPLITESLGGIFKQSIHQPANIHATDLNHSIFKDPNSISEVIASIDQAERDGQIAEPAAGFKSIATLEGHPGSGSIILNSSKTTIYNTFQAVNFGRNDDGDAKQDIIELLENEIKYLMNSLDWLKPAVTNDTIAKGTSENISVLFDATGRQGGHYYADLAIHSNDPEKTDILVPASMHVEGNPVLTLDRDSLIFAERFTGTSDTMAIIVKNTGTEVLEIDSLYTTNSHFGVENKKYSINYGDSAMLKVWYNAAGIGVDKGLLYFISNDKLFPSKTIVLWGESVLPPIIGVSPDSFDVRLERDQSTNEILTIRNLADGAHLKINLNVVYTDTTTAAVETAIAQNDISSSDIAKTGQTAVAERNIVGSQILVIQDYDAWGLYMADYIQNNFGLSPSVISSNNIDSTDFSSFKVIITTGSQPGNYYENISNHVSKFEEFAAAGGIIQYQVATMISNVTLVNHVLAYYGQQEEYNINVKPEHPVLSGLPHELYGNWANHCYLHPKTFPAGVKILTTTKISSFPTTIEYKYGSGTVIATGMTWEYLHRYGYPAGKMLYNSVKYALSLGIGWLNPEIKSAEIAPGASLNIKMKFDATGVKTGKHHASIVIQSNDPVHPVVNVPATLQVNTMSDSLSLVELYNSTNGPQWYSHTNWLTGPLHTWQGITMENSRVTRIYLNNNNLSGYITPEIGNLSKLQSLEMVSNQIGGSIPKECGNLSNLRIMNFAGNQLTGNIPPEIGNMTNLEEFLMNSNQITGIIPPEIGKLLKLRKFSLPYNQLTGQIPVEIGNCVNLEEFWLTLNQLTGIIPPEIGNLTHLIFVNLGYNQFTGTIPPQIGNLSSLLGIELNNNQLTGTIPPEMGNLLECEHLYLYNNQLTGDVPVSLTNLTKLMNFSIGYNRLQNLPVFNKQPRLSLFFVPGNKFTFRDIEPNVGFASSTFSYAPQDSIGERQFISLNEGDNYTISLITGGDHNVYQWYKNGAVIPGADSYEYKIINAAAGNAGNYTCEVTNTVATGLTLYSRPVTVEVKWKPHFTPVWTGNGLDHMNFYVITAKLDGMDLQPGSEIGIFDGGACVGSGVLTEVLNGTNSFEIRVSKDDPTTPVKDGYTPGQQASFKIWDPLRQQEVTASAIEYVFGTNTFEIGASTWLKIGAFSRVEQLIFLQTGWNIFSLNVVPDSMALIDIVGPLINEGVLLKVQNEAGAAIEPIPGQDTWIDNIGNWSATEGYKIRVSTNTALKPVGVELNTPLQIGLQTGWNIMGYPFAESQDAMNALGELITRNTLMKVQDETGAAIEPLPSHAGWIDNIGAFDPGEGYKVRVSENDVINLYPYTGAAAILKSTDPLTNAHFKPAWQGNGTDHMNIYITGVTTTSGQLNSGDEIGIYDGEICVGAGVVGETGQKLISLVVSADDPATSETDGFISGNSMSFKIWRPEGNIEIKVTDVEYVSGYTGRFEPMGTTMAGLKLNVQDPSIPVTSLGENYPNPFDVETVIPFTLGEKTDIDLAIYNLLGQRINTLVQAALEQGSYTATWNGEDQYGDKVLPGIYLYKLVAGNQVFVKRIELSK